MNVLSIDNEFNFNNLTLGTPQAVQGGSYFAKLFNSDSSLIYIQLPKSTTKQGITSTKKNKYCDLMYERNGSNTLIDWIEKLEERLLQIISEKKDIWFHNELSNEDIESMINPISRSFKSGKYVLVRTNIDCNKHTGKSKCVGYDDKEISIDIDTLESSATIIPLILLEGIRFTSRSFELDIKLIQFMIIDETIIENKCLIRNTSKKTDDVGLENPNLIDDSQDDVTEESEEVIVDDNTAPTEKVDEEVEEAAPIEKAKMEEVIPIENTREEEAIPVEKTVEEEVGLVEKEAEETENIKLNTLEKKEIEEITLDLNDNLDEIKIKEPNEIYYEIYNTAKKKAKELRTKALKAHLEAKQIKIKYMLDDSDDSENEEIDNYLE